MIEHPFTIKNTLVLLLTIISFNSIKAQKTDLNEETSVSKEVFGFSNNHKGLYPMPASEFVNVTIPKVNEYTIVQIINLAGNVVATRSTIYNQTSTFNLSNIKAGFYMVKLFNNNENTKVYKLVIQ